MNRRKMLSVSGLMSGSFLLTNSKTYSLPLQNFLPATGIYNITDELKKYSSLDQTLESLFTQIEDNSRNNGPNGAALYFPPGIWEISRPVRIPDNTILFGMGGFYHQNHILRNRIDFARTQHTVVRLAPGSNCNIIEPPNGKNLTGVIIQGLVLDGNRNEQNSTNSSNGINLPDSPNGERSNLAIRDVMIYNCSGNGFYAGNKQHEIRIENTHSSFNGGNGYKISGQDINLYNVWAGNNELNGFHFSGGGALKSVNVDSWGNQLNGLLVDNFTTNLVFTRFQSNSNTQNGVKIEGPASSISFIGSVIKTNSVVYNTYPLVYTGEYSNVLLTGNGEQSPYAVKFIGCEFGEGNVQSGSKYAIEDTSEKIRPNVIEACSFYENEFKNGIANDALLNKYIIRNCTAGKRGGIVRYNNPKEYIFISEDATIQPSNKIVEVDTSANSVVLSLPSLIEFSPGKEFLVTKGSSNNFIEIKPYQNESINSNLVGAELRVNIVSTFRIIHAKSRWLVV